MNSMIILYLALNNDQPMTAQKTQFETLSSGCCLYNLLSSQRQAKESKQGARCVEVKEGPSSREQSPAAAHKLSATYRFRLL